MLIERRTSDKLKSIAIDGAHNKSLDASGASVFLNLLGAARLALIRAAAHLPENRSRNHMKVNYVHTAILMSGLALICLVCLDPSLAAQSKMRDSQTKPNNCEDAMLYLDMSVSEAGKDREGYLIAVARLGDGERSLEFNRRRLGFARAYLENQRGWNRIVSASGERAKGYGRVELYVGGKLLYVLLYPKKGYISCGGLG